MHDGKIGHFAQGPATQVHHDLPRPDELTAIRRQIPANFQFEYVEEACGGSHSVFDSEEFIGRKPAGDELQVPCRNWRDEDLGETREESFVKDDFRLERGNRQTTEQHACRSARFLVEAVLHSFVLTVLIYDRRRDAGPSGDQPAEQHGRCGDQRGANIFAHSGRAYHSVQCSPVVDAYLASTGAEAPVTTPSLSERLHLDRIGKGDRRNYQLRDPVSGLNPKGLSRIGIEQQHPDFAAIAGVDQAGAVDQSNPMVARESGPRQHQPSMPLRYLNCHPSPNAPPLTGPKMSSLTRIEINTSISLMRARWNLCLVLQLFNTQIHGRAPYRA